MKKIHVLAVLNTFFFLLHLLASQLTQLKLLNRQTIGEVSDKYPTLFTPAGITFAIWGLIYLSLAAFCVYHLVKAFRAGTAHEANADLLRIGYLFMVNNLATGAWVVAWVQEALLLSVLLMGIQLLTLLAIQLQAGIYDPNRSLASRCFTQFPLSIYFGWICIATVANISATLVGLQWDGWGLSAAFWTLLLLGVATGITVFVVLRRRNPFVGLVTVWAFYGIVLKHQQEGVAASPDIISTAWAGLVLVALTVVFQFYRNSRPSLAER